MSFLHVDKEKCTQCGLCVEACPNCLIAIEKNEPQPNGLRECIACGHCVAVCPSGALDNDYAPLTNQVPFDNTRLDARTASLFLRSRRSIRSYRGEKVPRETLRQILDMARFAPTGGNSQGLSYMVISDKGVLQRLPVLILDWLEQEIKRGCENAPFFEGVVRSAKATGKDIILRDAPHLVVALCDKGFPRKAENAHFSFAYAEIFAPTVGVGTCWAGLFQRCAFAGYPPLLKALNLPEGKEVAGGLMMGYPRYRYYRLVDRNPLEVTWR
jgi:nitroreductase/NAD-dependent dihydropyrimidine dehydrogenase PreA subunit